MAMSFYDHDPNYGASYVRKVAILWKGQQWAVTTYGLECIDSAEGRYEIDGKRLLEDLPERSWITHMSEKGWVNMPDFIAALGVAVLVFNHKMPGIARPAKKKA